MRAEGSRKKGLEPCNHPVSFPLLGKLGTIRVMDDKLVAALVGGGASLAVALLGQIFNPVSQRRLEKQKAELQKEIEEVKGSIVERSSAQAARREYEYDARKRLYSEIEPLFFQLYEAVEECYFRILSLARTSRQGHLGIHDDSWVRNRGYYLLSTAYKLILPSVVYSLIQRRMTFIDLKLDEVLRVRYLLLKNLVHSFADPFDFAALNPSLPYEPDWEDLELQRKNPAVSRPQGLVKGDLENLLDELIVEDHETLRPLLFGEFEKHLRTQRAQDKYSDTLVAVYTGFTPEKDPILARMLIAQACLCHLLMATYRSSKDVQDLRREFEVFSNSRDVLAKLQWKDGAECLEVNIVKPYVIECLDWIEAAP